MVCAHIRALGKKRQRGDAAILGTTPLVLPFEDEDLPPPGRDATSRESPSISVTRDAGLTPTMKSSRGFSRTTPTDLHGTKARSRSDRHRPGGRVVLHGI